MEWEDGVPPGSSDEGWVWSLGTPAISAVVMGIFICGICIMGLNPWGAFIMGPLVSVLTFLLIYFCSWLSIFLGVILMMTTSLVLYKYQKHPDNVLVFPISLLTWCFATHFFLWAVFGYGKY